MKIKQIVNFGMSAPRLGRVSKILTTTATKKYFTKYDKCSRLV